MLAPYSQAIHRFTQSDLTTHGWVLNRLVAKYPNKNEYGWANYMRAMCDRNDYLFIAQPHCVALAEIMQIDTLTQKRVVSELFVWCEDRQNHAQIEKAVEFYDEFRDWGKTLRLDDMIVARDSDVPTEMIKARMGRFLNIEWKTVRV